ncbi:hypothetical protein TNCT_537321, partial [Trichonephila clavata]
MFDDVIVAERFLDGESHWAPKPVIDGDVEASVLSDQLPFSMDVMLARRPE